MRPVTPHQTHARKVQREQRQLAGQTARGHVARQQLRREQREGLGGFELDQQDGVLVRSTQSHHLVEEAARGEGADEVGNGLPLHADIGRHHVVAHRQCGGNDVQPQLVKTRRQGRAEFANVHDHCRTRCQLHSTAAFPRRLWLGEDGGGARGEH